MQGLEPYSFIHREPFCNLHVYFLFANDPSVGFSLHADYNYFKMFLADTGLFVTLAFMDRDYTENEIYRKLLSDKLGTDLGYVYGNAMAQMLKSAGNELFYYTFKEEVMEEESKTLRNSSYEIDFLLSRKDKICPIEVKSSGYNSHRSLDKFQQKFSARILYPKSVIRLWVDCPLMSCSMLLA